MRPTLLALEDRRLLSTIRSSSTTPTDTSGHAARSTCARRSPWRIPNGGDETITLRQDGVQDAADDHPDRLGQLELSDTTGTETITGPAAGVTVNGGGNEPGVPGRRGRHRVDLGTDDHRRQDAGNGGGLCQRRRHGHADQLHRQRQLRRQRRRRPVQQLRRHDHADQLHRQRQLRRRNGGGLYELGGTTTLTNCTVSGNSAAGSGGGLDSTTTARPR